MFQSLLGVLPDTLSADTARYALAGTAAVSVGTIVWLATLVVRRREDARTPALAAGSLQDLEDRCVSQMLRCRTVWVDGDQRRFVGWPHFVEEGHEGRRPTAISTAYGLLIGLTVRRDDNPFEHPTLVDTLWRLQLPDGGWRARSGAAVSRPEVTALVVGALSRAGADRGAIEESVGALERMFTARGDPQGRSSTYVVCAVLRGLVRAAPTSRLLTDLRTELVAGAVRDENRGGLLCWGHSLDPGRGSGREPSVVHTAHAVVALSRIERFLGPEDRADRCLEQGVRWLVRHGGLAHQNEQLRRDADDSRVERVAVGHFTAAWVAKALMSVPALSRDGEAHLTAATARVRESQDDGIWEWDDDRDRRPIWMTYQGISVLHAHALRAYGRTTGTGRADASGVDPVGATGPPGRPR